MDSDIVKFKRIKSICFKCEHYDEEMHDCNLYFDFAAKEYAINGEDVGAIPLIPDGCLFLLEHLMKADPC